MKSSQNFDLNKINPFLFKCKSFNEDETISDSNSYQVQSTRGKSLSHDSSKIHQRKRKRNDNQSSQQLSKFFDYVLKWIKNCIQVGDDHKSFDIKLSKKEKQYKNIREGKKILNYSIEDFLAQIKKNKLGKANKDIDVKIQNILNNLDNSLKGLKLLDIFNALMNEENSDNSKVFKVKQEYLDSFNTIKDEILKEHKENFKEYIQERYIDGKIQGRRSKSEKKI